MMLRLTFTPADEIRARGLGIGVRESVRAVPPPRESLRETAAPIFSGDYVHVERRLWCSLWNQAQRNAARAARWQEVADGRLRLVFALLAFWLASIIFLLMVR